MKDEERNPDQLNTEELKEVKGGIPYEMPNLVELAGGGFTCDVGTHCDSGGDNYCSFGRTCSKGIHDPKIKPPI